MTRDQFYKLAAEHELGHIANEILSTAIASVRVLETALRPVRAEDQTYLGGMPRPMPKNWPRHQNVPLAFVGQVATSSVPPDVCAVPLSAGILQFFVPPAPEYHDHEPSLDCGKVIFVGSQSIDEGWSLHDPNAAAKPLRSQLFKSWRDRKSQANTMPSPMVIPNHGFEWEVFPSLYALPPDPDAIWLPGTAQSFDFNYDADEVSYFDFRRAVLAKNHYSLRAQMFGFADAAQEDMEPIVNTFAGNPSSEVFRDWILLFALHSSVGGLAPEAACYYFWIHRDDLADARFDNVWLCIQRD